MDIVFTALILLASSDILSKYGNLICFNFRDIALKIAQKKNYQLAILDDGLLQKSLNYHFARHKNVIKSISYSTVTDFVPKDVLKSFTLNPYPLTSSHSHQTLSLIHI